ncbi:MAG: sigma-70 family RNA polymerase sigma factor [Gemmataceae bacterium]
MLRRVKAQDAEAWWRFVHLYGPLIYRWCTQAGVRTADMEDIAQEVFRAVAAAIAGFRHDRSGDSLRGWLRQITRNKICDAIRKMPPGGEGVGGSDAQMHMLQVAEQALSDLDPASAEADRLLLYRRAIESIMDDFEEHTRQAFYRVVVNGQSPADVASDLGMSINSVYLARARIMRRIREEFDGIIDE